MELLKPENTKGLCSKHMIEYFVRFFNAVSGSYGVLIHVFQDPRVFILVFQGFNLCFRILYDVPGLYSGVSGSFLMFQGPL